MYSLDAGKWGVWFEKQINKEKSKKSGHVIPKRYLKRNITVVLHYRNSNQSLAFGVCVNRRVKVVQEYLSVYS